ncbi:MAG: BON domain-containing protein [Candidatus Sulfotelmatobacter sp.]
MRSAGDVARHLREIIVENGNVELAGVVLNEVDRQIAYIQANSVPGVFSVKNKLMVASDVRD